MISAKLLQLVISASNDGIVVAEQEGDDNILIYANPAFETLTGYACDDILYQDCRFLQGDERDQEALQVIRAALKSGAPCRQILRNFRKDGTLFWNELSITPVYNESDNLTYFIGIQKNVTEQVQAQERIKELEAEVALLKVRLADTNA
ncbi:PAS domain-containing protein [Pseudomonas sp. EL_65y_Pfl2_R95]|uniref:PAS domain-containing protein n=1 Tax=Pseudomonas sp. EL_65y_Pfl2_R95 TaxID=3088698 RepID=UPI0030D715AE